jgi:hypothetical protein
MSEISQVKRGTMNAIFDGCVAILVFLAERLGMTYEAVNVWIFVIIWLTFTLILGGLIVRKHLLIKNLKRNRLIKERLNLSVDQK